MQVLYPLPSTILLSVPLLWFYFIVHKIKPDGQLSSLLYASGCLFVSYFIYHFVFTNHFIANLTAGMPVVGLILLTLAVSAACAIADMSILRSWTLQGFFLLLVASIPLLFIGMIFCVMNAGQANL
jgi:hypothetical protein